MIEICQQIVYVSIMQILKIVWEKGQYLLKQLTYYYYQRLAKQAI